MMCIMYPVSQLVSRAICLSSSPSHQQHHSNTSGNSKSWSVKSLPLVNIEVLCYSYFQNLLWPWLPIKEDRWIHAFIITDVCLGSPSTIERSIVLITIPNLTNSHTNVSRSAYEGGDNIALHFTLKKKTESCACSAWTIWFFWKEEKVILLVKQNEIALRDNGAVVYPIFDMFFGRFIAQRIQNPRQLSLLDEDLWERHEKSGQRSISCLICSVNTIMAVSNCKCARNESNDRI